MKHLKLFESFPGDTSWEITSDGTYLEMKKQKIDWDSSEISKVRSSLTSIDDGMDFSMSSNSTDIHEVEITNWTNGDGNKRFLLIPFKTDDEWIYVKEYYYQWTTGKYNLWRQKDYKPLLSLESRYETYYKCDELEGFIQLIMDRHMYLYEMN